MEHLTFAPSLKRRFLISAFDCLLSCRLTHCCQPDKVSEMNRDKLVSHFDRPTDQARQSKEKKSGNLHLIAARTRAKWWWLSPAEIPAISAAFCGNSVYIDFDITTPPACEIQPLKEKWYWLHRFSLFCFFLFPPSQIWFIVSQSSHLFWWVLYLTSPPWIATSSKNSISFRKWKLHHLRRVSIKLEGRRNGNVKIENLGREIRNTRGKNSFQMAKGNLSVDERFSSVRRYWCGERVAGGVAPCGRLLKNSLTTVIGSPYPPRPSIPLPLHPPPSSPQYSLKI